MARMGQRSGCRLLAAGGAISAGMMTATANRPTSAGCQRKWPTPPKIALPMIIANAEPITTTYHGVNGGSVRASKRPVRYAWLLPSNDGIWVIWSGTGYHGNRSDPRGAVAEEHYPRSNIVRTFSGARNSGAWANEPTPRPARARLSNCVG